MYVTKFHVFFFFFFWFLFFEHTNSFSLTEFMEFTKLSLLQLELVITLHKTNPHCC